MSIKIITSNKRKIFEFERFGLQNIQAISGPDLREVKGTAEEVILHKTLDAGKKIGEENILVEDTIVAVLNGDNSMEEIVDIRWRIAELAQMPDVKIVWKTSLGQYTKDTIKVYSGETLCRVVQPQYIPEDAFGFDPYLIPNGYTETVYELEKQGKKDEVSPRRKAVEHLINQQPDAEYKIADIPEWTGEYQHSEMSVLPKESVRRTMK